MYKRTKGALGRTWEEKTSRNLASARGDMKRLGILIGVLTMVGVGLLYVLQRPTRRPLSYQGQPIEHWFAQLPVAVIPPRGVQLNARAVVKSYGQQYGSPDSSASNTMAAMEAFGTNALPFLLAKLEGGDSAAERAVTKAAKKTGVRELPFRDAEWERLQAVTGLIQMKTITPEAKQRITSLATNRNTNLASAATYVLTRRVEQGDVFRK